MVLGKQAGIKTRVGSELIRQTSYVHMFNEGADLKLLQMYAGHKSARSTRAIVKNTRPEIPSPLNKIDLNR